MALVRRFNPKTGELAPPQEDDAEVIPVKVRALYLPVCGQTLPKEAGQVAAQELFKFLYEVGHVDVYKELWSLMKKEAREFD